MTAAALAEPTAPRRPPGGSDDPFRIGYRYVHTVDAGGTKTSRQVPLTEEDFLHPQEEDKFMLSDPHSIATAYLRHALECGRREWPRVRTFTEHRVDWQVPGILPHGPDVVVLDQFPTDWDSSDRTLRVADLGAEVLAVFEVTSESTRHIDFGDKFDEYARAGIRYYLVVDLAAPNGQPDLLGFRLIEGEYALMRRDPRLGYLVPRLGMRFRWEDGRVMAADEDEKDIPYSAEMATALARATARAEAAQKQADAEKSRADAEKSRADGAQTRADAEKARADAEKASADAERRRADDLARELVELKARLSADG